MTQSPIDWPAIRAKYEQLGISKNTLARMHGVSRQAIQQRAKSENWITPLLASPERFLAPMQATMQDAEELSPMEIVEQALAKLATFLTSQDGLVTLNQHKLFADSLSQYIKLKFLMPSDKPTESGLPLDLMPYLDNDDLGELALYRSKMDAVLERAEARKLEQEQGIRSIRKTANM